MATKQIIKSEFIKDVNDLSYKELTAKYGLNASILRSKIKELGLTKPRPKTVNVEWIDDDTAEEQQQIAFHQEVTTPGYTPETPSPSVFQ